MILIATAAFVAGTLIMNPNAIETMTVVAATVADAHGDDVDVGIVSASVDVDPFARSKI